MGTSTDGLLYWGYELSEDPPWASGEEPEAWGDGGEWEAVYAQGKGYPEADWKKRRELLKDEPCEILIHCSYNYPMYVATVTLSVQRAWRGYPQIINPQNLTIQPDWHDQLNSFCTVLGLDVSGMKTSWYLASLWG